MATSDLSSKSLGDILLQSGIGTPDHSAPLGSLYTNKSTGNLWRNLNGSTTWELLSTVAYGEATFQTNTSDTTFGASNTWTSGVYTFTEGDVVGFSAGTTNLTLLSGYSGTYEIRGDITISYQAGAANYEVGLSINGADPTSGTFNGGYVDATYTRRTISFQTIQTLTGGTNLSIDVRNLTSTAAVDLRHGQLFARKVG